MPPPENRPVGILSKWKAILVAATGFVVALTALWTALVALGSKVSHDLHRLSQMLGIENTPTAVIETATPAVVLDWTCFRLRPEAYTSARFRSLQREVLRYQVSHGLSRRSQDSMLW